MVGFKPSLPISQKDALITLARLAFVLTLLTIGAEAIPASDPAASLTVGEGRSNYNHTLVRNTSVSSIPTYPWKGPWGSEGNVCSFPHLHDGLQSTSRIFGGYTANSRTACSVVKVETVSSWLRRTSCTGSILGQNLVLTAAHCIWNPQKSLDVRRINIYIAPMGFITKPAYSVVQAHVYRDFSGIEYHNDLALLRVERSFQHYRIALLPRPEQKFPLEGLGFAAGFGAIAPRGSPQSQLREVVLQRVVGETAMGGLLKKGECSQRIICMRSAAHGTFFSKQSVASGDSGGPLFVKGDNGIVLLKGVAIYEFRKFISGFSDLQYHTTSIEEYIQGNSMHWRHVYGPGSRTLFT